MTPTGVNQSGKRGKVRVDVNPELKLLCKCKNKGRGVRSGGSIGFRNNRILNIKTRYMMSQLLVVDECWSGLYAVCLIADWQQSAIGGFVSISVRWLHWLMFASDIFQRICMYS